MRKKRQNFRTKEVKEFLKKLEETKKEKGWDKQLEEVKKFLELIKGTQEPFNPFYKYLGSKRQNELGRTSKVFTIL